MAAAWHGTAMRTYPTSKVRETPERWEEVQIQVSNQTPFTPDMLRGLKQTLCAPGPEDPTETETELCVSVSYGDKGQQWTATGIGALGAAD